MRYRDASGTLLHNSIIPVKYEFSSYDASYRFQGDIRGKDLIDYYDVDCVYTDQNPRQNSYGAVAGLGAVQRLKLWKDRYAGFYSITFHANRADGTYHEYQTQLIDAEIRNVDEPHRRLRLYVRGRRGSATSSRRHGTRLINPFNRSRQRSVGSPQSQAQEIEAPLSFRYLGIQFTDDEGKCFLWPTWYCYL